MNPPEADAERENDLDRLKALAATWSAIPFDGHLVLGHPSEGGLIVLNPRARVLWERFQRHDVAATEPADAELDLLLTAFRDAGLLDELRAPPPPVVAEKPPEFDATEICLDAVYACGTRPVCVRCTDPHLSALLAAVLAPCRTTASPQAELLVMGFREGFRLYEDGILARSALTLAQARNTILNRLIRLGRPQQNFAAILHGAAVSDGDCCCLLLGAGGSGKSTLAAGLIAAGWRLVSDDLIPLEAETGCIWTVPYALSVKEGSWSLLAGSFPAIATTPTYRFGAKRIRHLSAVPRPTGQAGYAVTACLLVRYDADAPASTEPLRPVEALAELVRSLSAIPAAPADRADLLRWLETWPCWQLTYASLSEAIGLVRQILADC